jgi:hypothetical protein
MDFVDCTNIVRGDFLVREDSTKFRLTIVYRPVKHNKKPKFLEEISAAKPPQGTGWLLLGDFNLIYKSEDKNNTKLDLPLMRHFWDSLNNCDLTEFPLQNRKFTWSNEISNPSLAKLDRVFCNAEWDATFSSYAQHALLATSLSYHCPPILLSNQCGPRCPKSFRFEMFWTYLPGFKAIVSQAWAHGNNALTIMSHYILHSLP